MMARLVMAQLPEGVEAELMDMPTKPELLRAAYGQMDLFIATRLHSGIFAIQMGVPTLFIGYLHKTRGLMEMLGMEEWMLEIGDVTEEVLWHKLEALWLCRDAVRSMLAERVPALRACAATVGPKIASDFHEYQSEPR